MLPDLFEQASRLLPDPPPDKELEHRGRLPARLRHAAGLPPAAKKVLLERTATRSVPAGLGGGTLDSLSAWADARLNVYEGRLGTDRTRHRAQAEKMPATGKP
ncbi:hypothetical protein SUDANB15_00462 [Streptomyces sp. enrichment culture]|uniref:hypothetical protein n=1 Tax=Streptomyces sp. enrichment culture TaxID=1795815 RepID=UPI003F54545C